MAEKEVLNEQMCASCPNRNKLSRALASLANRPEVVEGCDGYVVVSRGVVIGEDQKPGEEKPEGKWNCISTDREGNRRYTRNEWQTEMVCGRDEIAPAEGEVSFSEDSKDERGHRWVTYISGEKDDVTFARFAIAMYRSEANGEF